MTQTELLNAIRQEIERRRAVISECGALFYRGRRSAFDDLLSFLDTLPEQPVEKTSYDTQKYTPSPSVSIEDVARVQFASHAKVFDKKRKAVFDWEQFKEVASIFYSFGKNDSPKTKEKEQPASEGLEEEIERFYRTDEYRIADTLGRGFETLARHFAEWGAKNAKQ